MKKLRLSILAFAMGTAVVSCGPSAEELEKRAKEVADSTAVVQAEIARQDSIAKAEAEKVIQDSLVKVAEQAKLDSIANATAVKPKGGAKPKVTPKEEPKTGGKNYDGANDAKPKGKQYDKK